MNKSWLLVFSIFIFCFILSCKKNNNNTGNKLTGNWTFMSLTAQTESDNQYTNGSVIYKTVTLSQYTSMTNAGTATITSDSMTANGITYTIATTVSAYNYENGNLVDSNKIPFNYSIPPIISSTAYTLIGQDSISFSGQSLFNATGSSPASGAKYTINGDTLTLTSSIVKDSTNNSYGFPMTVHETASVKSVLLKQ